MGLLLDIDGTLLDSGRAIDGAADAVAKLRARGHALLFATNTSRKSRAEIGASLRSAGIDARDEEVWSASGAAAVLLRQAGVRRVHLLLTPSATEDWTGFERVDDAAEAVVVGDLGNLFDFERLNRAFVCLRAGARLVAAHRNRFWKNDQGAWALDAGPFVKALEYAAETQAELIGKPAPGFFHAAARLLGEVVSQLAIVGDDLEADVGGGRAAGLDTWLVQTGKFDAARLAATPRDRAPHHVIGSIRELPDRIPG
ncbi:MAG: HAD-IIA family hydrolase [bacterium]